MEHCNDRTDSTRYKVVIYAERNGKNGHVLKRENGEDECKMCRQIGNHRGREGEREREIVLKRDRLS